LQRGCKRFIVGDIGPETDWRDALEEVDEVIHLAARVHVMNDDPAESLEKFREVNVEGTRRLAECATAAGAKRFIFMSSIKVNGEETNTEKRRDKNSANISKEEDDPHPVDAYGMSKWEAEKILREIETKSGMEVTILRSPLIYGPGVKANFLKLIQLVDKGIPLPFGRIQNRRSFLGLTNLVDLICCCLEHPAAAGETFMASDGEDVSTPELLNRIAYALEKPCRMLPIPKSVIMLGGALTGKSGQIKRLCGSLQIDSSKVRRVLSWSPPCTMTEELAKTIKWYREEQAKRGT